LARLVQAGEAGPEPQPCCAGDGAPEDRSVRQGAAIGSGAIRAQRGSDTLQLLGGVACDAARKCLTAHLRMDR